MEVTSNDKNFPSGTPAERGPCRRTMSEERMPLAVMAVSLAGITPRTTTESHQSEMVLGRSQWRWGPSVFCAVIKMCGLQTRLPGFKS